MTIHTDVLFISSHDYNDEDFWAALYPFLLALITKRVYDADIPSWKGQEQEVAEDIVQTAILKTFESLQKASEKHKVIHSVTAWSVKIAKNSFYDFVRKEKGKYMLRFVRLEDQQLSVLDLLVDSAQEVEEKIDEEQALVASVKTIAAFSTKLRSAILVDLANLTCFDETSSALQQAFLAAGIHLQDYQRAPSLDSAERGRQSALRSLAYKRVAQEKIV